MDVKIKLFGLNPLNQVYVFNNTDANYNSLVEKGLNPLNQVYVFNTEKNGDYVVAKGRVLIP